MGDEEAMLHKPKLPEQQPDVGLHENFGSDPSSSVKGLPILQRDSAVRAKPKMHLLKAMKEMLVYCHSCLESKDWEVLTNLLKIVRYCTHRVPSFCNVLVAAGGTRVATATIRACGPSLLAHEVLGQAIPLLEGCIRADEKGCDDVVESNFMRLLLQLLQSNDVSTITKQDITSILHFLASSKLLYRDTLHGAGALDAMLRLLTDAASMCDLALLQGTLWVLICLADDDFVYKDSFREAGALHILTHLLHVYRLPAFQHLDHIAALIVRCLHILTHGDDVSKEALRQLGIVDMLVAILGEGMAAEDDPQVQTLEMDLNRGSKKAGAKKLGEKDPITAAQRLAMVLLLKYAASQEAAKIDEDGRTRLQLLYHALLLPVLAPCVPPPSKRLGLLREAAGALKSLICDSPDNQEAAVQAGVIPFLVKLLDCHSSDIVGDAAETISFMIDWRDELVAAGAIEALARLLHSSADALLLLAGTPRVSMNAYALSRNPGRGSDKDLQHMAIRQGSSVRPSTTPSSLVGIGRQGTGMTDPADQRQAETGTQLLYRLPAAALKALLRLMSSDTATQDQFLAAGGLFALFAVMRAESGNAQSRLLSSAVSLLNMVLENNRASQEAVEKAHGVEGLVGTLTALMQPSAGPDVFQLRVSVLVALQRAMTGNAVNKAALRDQGGIRVIAALLQAAATRVGASHELDDVDQVAAAAIEALCAAIPGCPGNQDAAYNLGVMPLLVALAAREAAPTTILLGALRALGYLADGNYTCQMAVTASGTVANMLRVAELANTPAVAETAVTALCSVMRGNKHAKDIVLGNNAVPTLIGMLRHGPDSLAASSAAAALAILAADDAEMQNRIISAGALKPLVEILEAPAASAATCAALQALTTLCQHNTLAKNTSRQQHIFPHLVRLLGERPADMQAAVAAAVAAGQASTSEEGEPLLPGHATLAAAALAELCDSNHANKEAMAAAGGMEVLVALLRAAVGSSLADAHAARLLVAASAHAIGCAAEFHNSNKVLVREAGGLVVLASFLLMVVAEVPDLRQIRKLSLLPAVAAVSSAVSRLAQECEDNQRHLMMQADFVPCLIKLLFVDEPDVAFEAARALEFAAIRSSILEEEEDDPADFESDAIKSFVKALLMGTRHASVVKEASRILNAVLHSAETHAQGAAGRNPSSRSFMRSDTLDSATADPARTLQHNTSSVSEQPDSYSMVGGGRALQHSTSSIVERQNSYAMVGNARAMAAVAGSSLPGQVPAGELDIAAAGVPGTPPFGRSSGEGVGPLPRDGSMAVHHGQGLAMPIPLQHYFSRGASFQELPESATAAFKDVMAVVCEGPWRPFKHQLAWMLFLLALRSPANRDLIRKLDRTSVAPVAQQLENSENYQFKALVAWQQAQRGGGPASAPPLQPPLPLPRKSMSGDDGGDVPSSVLSDAGSEDTDILLLRQEVAAYHRGAAVRQLSWRHSQLQGEHSPHLEGNGSMQEMQEHPSEGLQDKLSDVGGDSHTEGLEEEEEGGEDELKVLEREKAAAQ